MKPSVKILLASAATVIGLGVASQVAAHFDEDQPMQSYRQSYFTLLASNFGPMVAMVKGEMPWDEARMQSLATDFEDLTQLNLMRGFSPGSEKGTTRAKPEIWSNKADFEQKFVDLQTAADALDDAVESGDRKAIAAAVGNAGKACKACHDDYKAKDYLY